MKILRLFAVTFLLMSLIAAPVAAAEKTEMKEHGMMKHHGMMKGAMKEHHVMVRNMMGMLKETMTILKDLSGAPTPAQKKRLGEMIERMDDIMDAHKRMMKEKSGGKTGR